MAVENLEQKLAQIVEKKTSTWKQDAEWRKENRSWLKKSANIAMLVLDKMDELGWNQKQLALELGTTPQYVSKLCKGQENLTLKNIDALERALGIDLSLDVSSEKQEIRSPSLTITQIFDITINDFIKKLVTEKIAYNQLNSTSVIVQLNIKATNLVKPEVEDFTMCA